MSLIDDIKLLAERGKTPGIRYALTEAAERLEYQSAQLAARDRTIAELKSKIEDQEWLETSRENLLKISKRQQATIAEQGEALEGYRSLLYSYSDDGVGPWHWILEIPTEKLPNFLPAHEIAELRKRGVEVGE